MTQTTKCDRCGDILEGKFSMSRIVFNNEMVTTAEYDLCPKCINELAKIVIKWVEDYRHDHRVQ